EESRPSLCCSLDQAFSLHDLEVRERNGTRSRMRGVSVSVHPSPFGRHVSKHLENTIRDSDSTKRDIRRRDSLSKRDNVRFDFPMIECKPFSRPPETGNHFVRNKQDVVLVADLTNTREIIRSWWSQSTCPLHRLRNECGDRFRSLVEDRLFKGIYIE